MPATKPLAEKIFLSLFKQPDDDSIKFSESQMVIKRMYEDVFTKWLDNPELQDTNIVSFIKREYQRSRTQAYKDVSAIKSVLGNVRNASKEWQRYTVIKMLKESYDLAKKNNRYKEMVMAADKLGKYTKLDKDDLDEIPWEDIVPPSWEPSSDTKLLNIPDMPKDINALKETLRKKYLRKKPIESADIIEQEDGDQ